jgi:hypothetical protein
MPEQMRALDRSRFNDTPLASVTDEEMIAIERLFLATCGLAQYLSPAH